MRTFVIFILSCFIASNILAQTSDVPIIESQVKTIDSLFKKGQLNKLEYKNMSFCGGHLQGHYIDSNLMLITSVFSAEAGHISQDIYFHNDTAIKIVFKQHSAEWDKHSKNHPLEAEIGDYKNMTYTDTTYQIYLTKNPVMEKYAKSKLINKNLDLDLLNQLTSCYKSMILELKGNIKNAELEIIQRKKDEIIIIEE